MADVGSLGTRLLRIVLGLCALVLVLLALYVSLGRQLVPLVAEYRQQLEDEAGKQLGIPVRIAELADHRAVAPVAHALRTFMNWMPVNPSSATSESGSSPLRKLPPAANSTSSHATPASVSA